MWCEVADDPVVVSKSRPVKPGNRVEEKTAMTSGLVQADDRTPKASARCEGEKFQGSGLRRELRQRAAQVKVAPPGTIRAVPGETALLEWPADVE